MGNAHNRRAEDRRAPGALQWGEPTASAAPAGAQQPAAERFGYTITPRAQHLGGGWRLQLLDGNQEAGGSVYPAASPAESDDAYQEALDDGEAWLTSRGDVAGLRQAAAPAPDWLKYELTTDTLLIHGFKYSGELFRGMAFGLNVGEAFRIVRRADDVLWIERLAAPALNQSEARTAALEEVARFLEMQNGTPASKKEMGVAAKLARVLATKPAGWARQSTVSDSLGQKGGA
jgi:hypothetical protein